MSVVELSGEVGREVRVREGWSERGMERERERERGMERQRKTERE